MIDNRYTNGAILPYIYTAFGLMVRSPLALPELVPAEASDPDVTIRFGALPDLPEVREGCGYGYELTPDRYLFGVKGVCKYQITLGREIVIDPADNARETDVRLFLLGSCMGLVLLQRRLLPLHGSAVRLPEGGAAVFLGKAGAGKSTLAGAFRQRGYAVLSDDVSVATLHDGEPPLLLPAYPEIKLREESAVKLGHCVSNLPRARSLDEKYSLLFHGDFDETPVPLRLIYVLETADDNELDIQRLAKSEKLNALMDHTYRVETIGRVGMQADIFKQCGQLANHVTVSRLRRPGKMFLLEELVDLVMEDFKEWVL